MNMYTISHAYIQTYIELTITYIQTYIELSPYIVSEVNLRVMTMKEYSKLPRPPEVKPRYQMQLRVLLRILLNGESPYLMSLAKSDKRS